MRIKNGVVLFAGNADHLLDGEGVIAVQGSFKSNDPANQATYPVFSIIGGTGTYELAQGTITYSFLPNDRAQFDYKVLP
jgi:hypothetical protein